MQLQPIMYVTNMDQSIEWYESVLDTSPEFVSEHWSSFPVNGATLALHISDDARPAGATALSLVVAEPLEEFIERITPVSPIQDQPFGRSCVVADPDGTLIQVNEHAH